MIEEVSIFTVLSLVYVYLATLYPLAWRWRTSEAPQRPTCDLWSWGSYRGAFLKWRNILSNLVLETAVGTHHGWTWCSVISWCRRSRDIAHTFPGTVNSAGSHSRRYFASRWAYQGQAWKNDGCNPVSYGFISSWFRWLMSFIGELSKTKPCWSLFSVRRTEQNQTEQNQYREKIFWDSSAFVWYRFFTIRPTCKLYRHDDDDECPPPPPPPPPPHQEPQQQ